MGYWKSRKYLSEYTIAEAWERLSKAVREIKLCEDCAGCEKREICHACPASMYAETGRFDGRPDYMCRFTDSLLEGADRRKSEG